MSSKIGRTKNYHKRHALKLTLMGMDSYRTQANNFLIFVIGRGNL